MPFDGQAKPDVFSLEGLIAWLRKQPGETEYDWFNISGGCLLGRYLTARGAHPINDYLRLSCTKTKMGEIGDIAGAHPRTYAAALSRAEALLANKNGHLVWRGNRSDIPADWNWFANENEAAQ